MTGVNLHLDLGLPEMPAHSAWTVEDHFSLPDSGKADELFGSLVDMMWRLGRKKKCLQNKNYKMLPNAQNSFLTYTNAAFRQHGECHVIISLKASTLLLRTCQVEIVGHIWDNFAVTISRVIWRPREWGLAARQWPLFFVGRDKEKQMQLQKEWWPKPGLPG